MTNYPLVFPRQLIEGLVLLLISTLLLFAPNQHALAGGWFSFSSVGKDGAREVARAVDRASLNLNRLQNDLDVDVREYIAELDQISASRLEEAKEAVNIGTDSILGIAKLALKDIKNLESKAYYDAKDLLRQTQCLGEQYSQTLKETLKDAIEIISESEAKVKIPVLGTARFEIKIVNIKSPFEAYETAKLNLIRSLHAIQEKDSALSVLAGYGELYRLAMKTSCHYQGHTLEKYFYSEMAAASGKSVHWETRHS